MVDIWWGIVEHAGPQLYDFSAYQRLISRIAASGLKVQAVMSFHAAGGNVGDTCNISLPGWVVRIPPSPSRFPGTFKIIELIFCLPSIDFYNHLNCMKRFKV